MEAIGGYFELELRKGEHYHQDALRLNTARNCFEYILLARKYTKVYIPYYTCEVMLQPLHRHHIAYEFYHINESLEPVEIIQLGNSEAFLYTNYFGLKQNCVEYLASIYQSQLIVDNAQAFYAPRIAGIDTFYSPRKFFGVPDGGYLYTDKILGQDISYDKSYARMSHLLLRIEEGAESGYSFFRQADESLDNQPMRRMSKLTEALLVNIDYKEIQVVRQNNYKYIHSYLQKNNLLDILFDDNMAPMVYPFLCHDDSLRKRLISNKIFVATYWGNIFEWCTNSDFEYTLCQYLFPIPLDQRYGKIEMEEVINNVSSQKLAID